MKIESTAQLASIIHNQISSMRNANSALHRGNTTTKKEIAKTKKESSEEKKNLGQLIVQRVASLSQEDKQRRKKVFRVFLETILQDELDERLIADPRFFRMVEDIQNQMQSDPELAPIIEQAIDLLLVSSS